MKIIQEFKAFALRGNVMDLAVGVIIGAAFGKIVSALTDSILMPVLGAITSNVNFNELAWKIPSPVSGKVVVIGYGIFINAIIQFVILAFCVFLLVKLMNFIVKKQEAALPPPTNEEKLLTEIRDLLKGKQA